MSRIHGKNAKFSYNAVALESNLGSIEQDSSRPMADVTAFADSAVNVLPGKPKHAYKLGGFFDPAAGLEDATLFADINVDTARATSYIPGGGAPSATNPNYTGQAFLAKYTIKTAVGAAATFDADLEVTGALTRAST